MSAGTYAGRWRFDIVPWRAACLAFAFIWFPPAFASAGNDLVRSVESKQEELKEREKSVKRDEARLAALRKDVDEKIEAYTKLLARLETVLKRYEVVKDDKLENVVKAYEAMPPEDAAARLSVLDDETALLIVTRMKGKKAGAIMAVMAPSKAAKLTRNLSTPARKKQH
jgi:flagellar motility protein MotE (MotC chaperone)